MTAIENAKVGRRVFNESLLRQYMKRRTKEEVALEKQCKNLTESYIVAMYFFDQYHSPHCWKTRAEAN